MSRETGKSVARLAARRLSGEIKKLSPAQQLSVCASCVSQAQAEQESVKAWGMLDGQTKKLLPWADASRAYLKDLYGPLPVVPILITRTDKRTQANRKGLT